MLALTGVTGRLGGAVARGLAGETGLRLVVRDASRAPRMNAEVAVASYGDGEAVKTALAGVDVLFMVSAAESETRLQEHLMFVAAAAASGVRHIVYTSFAAAAPEATFTLARDHFHTEEAIKASGMDFTMLRDNFYADELPLYADASHVVRGPAGDGRCSHVVRSDVAEVAAEVLRRPADHAGLTYTLTGPEALTFPEALAVLREVTGRPYRFVDETVEEAYASRRAGWPGYPEWHYDAWVSTYTAVASGELSMVSGDVERILGRPATSLREFAASLT